MGESITHHLRCVAPVVATTRRGHDLRPQRPLGGSHASNHALQELLALGGALRLTGESSCPAHLQQHGSACTAPWCRESCVLKNLVECSVFILDYTSEVEVSNCSNCQVLVLFIRCAGSAWASGACRPAKLPCFGLPTCLPSAAL